MTAVEMTTERVMLVRSFEVPLQDGWDGRTLDTLIAPYNQPATVSDPPHYRPYQEEFLPGAFHRQLTTPGRDKVLLNMEHEQGIRGVIGRSLSFEDREDGLHGCFGVLENADGDKALALIRDGTLTGLSLEFMALSSRRMNGVVQRVRAQLDKVAICRYPAYAASQVLAVRTETEVDGAGGGDDIPDVTPPKPARTSEVDEQLAALGFEPLRRTAPTTKPWDGSADRFTDDEYAAAALLCRPGEGPVKERYSLPVLEPDGSVNVNALGAAAAVLCGARSPLGIGVTRAMRAAAARKLIRYYNAAGIEVPASLRIVAATA